MQRVRMSVRENRLTSTRITDEDYRRMLELGRGWVAEEHGTVVGFAIATAWNGNVWALFVDPSFEGQGVGRQLHTVMIEWMTVQPAGRWWLTTEAGTRAERFYERAGWTRMGLTDAGEVRFERAVSAPT